MAFVLQVVINEIEETRSLEPLKKLNKAYRPNAHLPKDYASAIS